MTCHISAALLGCLAGTNKCSVIRDCKLLCKTLYRLHMRGSDYGSQTLNSWFNVNESLFDCTLPEKG